MALAAPAAAAGGVNAYLARYDRNGDGKVALAEYQAYLGRGFARLDRDGDGVVRGAEWPQSGRPPLPRSVHDRRLAAAFVRQDRDHDGFLDARELTAPPRRRGARGVVW